MGVICIIYGSAYWKYMYSFPRSEDRVWMISPNEVLRTQFGQSIQDDEILVRNIRQRWLVRPPPRQRVYSDKRTYDKSQVGQSIFVDSLLQGKRNGIFVECGALDGEAFSNTLYLESKRHWTGLLIEANQKAFKELLKKGRNAYSINACVSTSNSTGVMKFAPAWLLGGLVGTMDDTHLRAIGPPMGRAPEQLVQCFPMYSMMVAAGLHHVDFISLDIEGAELEVLRTLPFDKIRIEVIAVEYRSSDMKTINRKASVAKLEKLRAFFKTTNLYKEAGILPKNADKTQREELGLDVFFKRI